MAITSYSTLQSTVLAYFDAAGDTDMSGQVQTFIALAEERLNYGSKGGPVESEPLRVREMEVSTDLTPSSGVCTLPDDYLEWRRVTALTSQRRTLKPAASNWIDWRYPTRGAGYPEYFVVEGSSLTVLPTTT